MGIIRDILRLILDFIVQNYSKNPIYESLHSDEQKYFPVPFQYFIEGLCNIEITNNDGEYLNKALALLNKAAMDATTKRDLRNALIVANASYQLWTSSEK